MTTRSKWLLAGALLLSLGVIASSLLYVLSTGGLSASPVELATASGIVFVSVLSVVFVYFMKVRRKPDERKLDPSYFREYEIIKDAIMNSPLPASYKKNIQEDVLEMLLTAQTNGKNVHETVGDAGSFAQSILNACLSKPRLVVIGFLDCAMAFLFFILLISTLLWLEDWSKGFFNQPIDRMMVLFMALISFVLIPVIRRLTVEKNAWFYLLPLASGLLFIGLAELLRAFFYEIRFVKDLLDGSLVLIPNATALLILLLAMIILLTLRMGARRMPKLK